MFICNLLLCTYNGLISAKRFLEDHYLSLLILSIYNIHLVYTVFRLDIPHKSFRAVIHPGKYSSQIFGKRFFKTLVSIFFLGGPIINTTLEKWICETNNPVFSLL